MHCLGASFVVSSGSGRPAFVLWYLTTLVDRLLGVGGMAAVTELESRVLRVGSSLLLAFDIGAVLVVTAAVCCVRRGSTRDGHISEGWDLTRCGHVGEGWVLTRCGHVSLRSVDGLE